MSEEEPSVAEKMSSILGFVTYHQGGEIRVPLDVFRNPPQESSIVVIETDEETDELVIKLEPVDE